MAFDMVISFAVAWGLGKLKNTPADSCVFENLQNYSLVSVSCTVLVRSIKTSKKKNQENEKKATSYCNLSAQLINANNDKHYYYYQVDNINKYLK